MKFYAPSLFLRRGELCSFDKFKSNTLAKLRKGEKVLEKGRQAGILWYNTLRAVCRPPTVPTPQHLEVPPMWRYENRAQFLACLNDLEKDPLVLRLQEYHQHTVATTRYDHCVCVAYFSFLICRKLGWDYRAAARGGLLHDLYHDKWEGSEDGALSRWRTHPRAALENARRFGLSPREEDIIVKHMFPVTLQLPRYKESYVVSLADKLAAVLEKTHLATPLGIRKSCRAIAFAAAAQRPLAA